MNEFKSKSKIIYTSPDVVKIPDQELQKEIKKRIAAEELNYQSTDLLNSILNNSNDGIAILQAVKNSFGRIDDFRFSNVNLIMAQILGQTPEKLINKINLKEVFKKVSPNFFHELVKVVETGNTFKKDFYYRKDNSEAWYNFTVFKVADGCFMAIRDISKTKRLELEIERITKIDSLTQVYNRLVFDETLNKEWQICQREQQFLSLIMLDIDLMKMYNDIYGYPAGDSCLVKISELIKQILKRPRDIVSRYTGEEFIIILPYTNKEGAVHIAELLRNGVKKLQIPHSHSPVSNYLTISLGVSSVIPTKEIPISTFLKTADQALYTAKGQGRDRVIFKICQ